MHAAPLITWKQAPFLRLLIPFSAGIVLQCYTNCPLQYLLLVAAVSITIIIAVSKASVTTLFKYKNILAYALLILLATTGAWRMYMKTESLKPNPSPHIQDSSHTYIATIQEPVTEKTNSFKTIARITHKIAGDSIFLFNAYTLLYLQKSHASSSLYYGDKIVFSQQLQPVKAPLNPGNFNFKSYCEQQGVFYQIFLREKDFRQLPQQHKFSLKKSMYIIRDSIVDILRRYIPGTKEAGLAEALLIGYKEDLDKSLIQSYSNTGVIHVIAISGLHLGLIYMLLALLCKPIADRKWVRLLRPFFIIT